MPSCDQTGVPLHFHSSTTSGSACLMSLRILPRVFPRQSPSSAILFEMRSDAFMYLWMQVLPLESPCSPIHLRWAFQFIRHACDPFLNWDIALKTKNGTRPFSQPPFVADKAIFVRMALVVLRCPLEELRIRS